MNSMSSVQHLNNRSVVLGTACCMLVVQTDETDIHRLPGKAWHCVIVLVLTHTLPLLVCSDGARGDLQMSVGKQLKQILDIDSSVRIGYLAHVRGPATRQ